MEDIIKLILDSKLFNDEQKVEIVKNIADIPEDEYYELERILIEEQKESFIDYVRWNIENNPDFGMEINDHLIVPFSQLYENNGEEIDNGSHKIEYSVERFYRYESPFYDESNVGPNSRDFCRMLVALTTMRALRHSEIVRFNNQNEGFGPNGSNVYSVYKYRGGVNCKHRWVRYLRNSETGLFSLDPVQPRNVVNKDGVSPRLGERAVPASIAHIIFD